MGRMNRTTCSTTLGRCARMAPPLRAVELARFQPRASSPGARGIPPTETCRLAEGSVPCRNETVLGPGCAPVDARRRPSLPRSRGGRRAAPDRRRGLHPAFNEALVFGRFGDAAAYLDRSPPGDPGTPIARLYHGVPQPLDPRLSLTAPQAQGPGQGVRRALPLRSSCPPPSTARRPRSPALHQ
jgi:hypothetical protein